MSKFFNLKKSLTICSRLFWIIKGFCSIVNRTIHVKNQLMQRHKIIFSSSQSWNCQLAFNKILFAFLLLVFIKSKNFYASFKIEDIYRCGRNQATLSFIRGLLLLLGSWIYKEFIILIKSFPIKIHCSRHKNWYSVTRQNLNELDINFRISLKSSNLLLFQNQVRFHSSIILTSTELANEVTRKLLVKQHIFEWFNFEKLTNYFHLSDHNFLTFLLPLLRIFIWPEHFV